MRDAQILEFRSVLKSSTTNVDELKFEITTLRNYITDLKQMIKMLLNPEGIEGLDKQQVGEIALTSMDQYLD